MFRRRPPLQGSIITAQFPNPKMWDLSASNVSISACRAPESMDEALACSAIPPRPPPHAGDVNAMPKYRNPLERSQSSEYHLEIRKNLAAKEPRSRKVDPTTIRTDATDTQPAFESDAFAIQMPTTREPIIEAPVFRAKLPTPSKAQIEAYQMYKRKAQQVREQNNEGVRVPSKIISYDYAYAGKNAAPPPLEINSIPPASPPHQSPAGSFPVSPLLAQGGWGSQFHKKDSSLHMHVHGPGSTSGSSQISISRKPVGTGPTTSSPTHPRILQHSNTEISAPSTPSSPRPPPKFKIRFNPKSKPFDPPQKESWSTLYTRTSTPPSSNSHAQSPPKPLSPSTPTASDTSASGTDGDDPIFRHTTTSIPSNHATLTQTPLKHRKKGTPTLPRHTLTSRWAWLRPSGPRVLEPGLVTATPPITSTPPASSPRPSAYYTSPFPPARYPSSPTPHRKLSRAQHPPTSQAEGKGKSGSGFAQVVSVGYLVVKLCLVVYVLVGLYFILDAVREAVHVMGAPFRGVGAVVRGVWGGVVWVGGRVVGGLF